MGQRHKHADVIIAWAEGKDVQVWDEMPNDGATMLKITKWYALDMNGDMIYLGEYEDFEGAATDKDDGSFVWIASEETARTWLTQLKEMLE